MALNRDFRVKDSLYVGTSGFFAGTNVSIDTGGKILSGGRDLADLFKCNSAALTQGNCITSFSYDGTTAATVAIDSTASGNWDSAYTWCTTNGSNVYDTVTSPAQGVLTLTDVGNSPDTVVLGLQAGDSPTFAGLTLNGEIDMTADKIVNVADPTAAQDAATKAYVDSSAAGTVCSVTAGNGTITIGGTATDPTVRVTDTCVTTLSSAFCAAASSTQGNISLTRLNGSSCTLDIGLCSTDNVSFNGITTNDLTSTNGVCANNICLGMVAAKTISAFGYLTIGGTAGTILCNSIELPDITASTDNSVLIRDSNNCIAHDEIDPKVWDIKLVDYNGTSQTGYLTKYIDSTGTIDESIISETGTAITVNGSLSAVSLSGDGAGITNITATAVNFPSDAITNLTSTDKLFVNDGANKNITYLNLLTDVAGETGSGLTVTAGNDSICFKNASALADDTILFWDDTNGQLANSIITTNAGGNKITVGGDHLVTGSSTIYGNLSVTGDFTCIETTVSTTSALSVTNTGTGPALYVKQGGTQPIAHFIDSNGGDIIFADDGKVGIGTFTPSEKLDVVGNITASGNLNIDGNATIDGTITAPSLGAGVDDSVVILDSDGKLRTDEIDSRVWGSSLVDGAGSANIIPKWTDGNTIGDSSITDTGSLVTVDSDTKIAVGHSFSIYGTGGSTPITVYAQEKIFTATVGTGGTTVATFAKSDFNAGKYIVTLINGVNKTVFEILVTYNDTNSFGTVYGIVDAQTASQLTSIDVSNSGSTIDLVITSASAPTTAIIHGKAFY